MTVKLIVAFCKNKGIGKNNKLPWHYSEDLKHFSTLTKGSYNNMILMGRKTWESLPSKPLPNRFNAILSNHLTIDNEKTQTFSSIQDAITFFHEKSFQDLWIIGGYQIYKTVLDMDIVDELHISYINENYDCDTYFPDINTKKYRIYLKNNISEKIQYHIYIRSHL